MTLEKTPVAAQTDLSADQTTDARQAFDPIEAILRPAILTAFNEAAANKHLILRARGGRVFGFTELTELFSDRPRYICNTCREFWRSAVNLAVLDDEMNLFFPVLDAMENIPEGMAVYGDLVAAGRKKLANAHFDLVKDITSELLQARRGEFDHFSLMSEQSASEYHLITHRGFDERKGDIIINRLRTDNSLPLMQYFNLIKARVLRPDTLKQLESYANLVEKYNKTSGSLSRLWRLYSSAASTHPKLKWLLHLDGSVAGVVIKDLRKHVQEGGNKPMSELIQSVIDRVDEFTDPEGYKKRTAAASEALLDNTMSFLKMRGWESALERRMIRVDEVDQTYWVEPTVGDAPVVADDAPMSALERARLKVATAAKKEDISDSMRKQLEALSDKPHGEPTQVSTNQLLEKLVGAKRVTLPLAHSNGYGFTNQQGANTSAYCAITTCSIDGQAYPLFKQQNTNHPDHFGVVSVKPMGLNGIANHIADLATKQQLPSVHSYTALRVERVVQSGSWLSLHIPEMEDVFKTVFTNHGGTLIMGAHVVSEHYGYSRAIGQLSMQIPVVYEGEVLNQIVLSKGLFVNVTDANDITTCYHIVVNDTRNPGWIAD